jgi:serine/threonine protein kinase
MLVSSLESISLTSLESATSSYQSSEDLSPSESIFKNEELAIVKCLGESRFPVFLVTSSQSNKYYVMKVFPWENGAISPFYLKEVRFAELKHPNIISIPYFEESQDFLYYNQMTKVSYILMEYASYGDFHRALTKHMIPFHDKLLRTYFHQLIEGLEFMHSTGRTHLDLKPENLLIADDYKLKIADFDFSHMPEDGEIWTRGTKNFRAPEIFSRTCKDPQAADIYSVGIVLFLLKANGTFPYGEDAQTQGPDMISLKEEDPKMFWEYHCEFGERHSSFFSEDFKSLFLAMTKFDPEKRPTIAQIKESKWYNGDIYTNEEFIEFMNGRFD